MKITILTFAVASTILFSCDIKEERISIENTEKTENSTDEEVQFDNKGHQLVYDMVQKVGNYKTLSAKKDVAYTYTYKTPDNQTDISNERYIFNGELSYGKYEQHERTLAQYNGAIEQGYDGNEFWLKNNGEIIDDEKSLARVKFNRPTNFYWFTMMQKLLDPGLNYELLEEVNIDNQAYDVVKVTFDAQDDKPTDIYQLYINKETQLVDQFLFTVADFGKMEVPNLMKLKYEEVEGILIPTDRKYQKSTWNAEVEGNQWVTVNWSNIKFNTGLTKADFKKENEMGTSNKTSLKSKLEEKKANFETKASDNKKRAYREGIESVEKSGIVSSAKQVGDKAPNFTLNNALGNPVELKDVLKKGKVVLTWYRGGWCPYCNLTLHQLQEELPNFKANGATLIALTPELPDNSISTAEKNDLEFEVLSDIGNKVAHEYGIVFKLTDEVAGMYNESFDMNAYNGDKSNELPLAATFIIDENGEIIYAFLDADYRNRAEPSEITEFLKNN
ncbi:peroxiredoxin-like family protein [Brumimicrobium mesophilum]|uniref:peroxiredoxin-like family protein n=1 Tax=Brumimicrobium mesophilum TaxID=392717 RepID=UPI001F407E94|nr:peroxiredoxin-like family protein [Brumimicrobium mesophilum]